MLKEEKLLTQRRPSWMKGKVEQTHWRQEIRFTWCCRVTSLFFIVCSEQGQLNTTWDDGSADFQVQGSFNQILVTNSSHQFFLSIDNPRRKHFHSLFKKKTHFLFRERANEGRYSHAIFCSTFLSNPWRRSNMCAIHFSLSSLRQQQQTPWNSLRLIAGFYPHEYKFRFLFCFLDFCESNWKLKAKFLAVVSLSPCRLDSKLCFNSNLLQLRDLEAECNLQSSLALLYR